jgi:hypothetical protein
VYPSPSPFSVLRTFRDKGHTRLSYPKSYSILYTDTTRSLLCKPLSKFLNFLPGWTHGEVADGETRGLRRRERERFGG